MHGTVTIEEAIRQGKKSVYGLGRMPLILNAALAFLFYCFQGRLNSQIVNVALNISLVTLIPAWIFMWLWWSVQVPKWKLWAYASVNDVVALKIAAIKAGIIWPDNHIFEKTEICSKDIREQIHQLEGRVV
jgi:hypothetical protein